MATMELRFYSKALKRLAVANVLLPEIPKQESGVGNPCTQYKTLYLLHGLSGDHTNWLNKTSIERYAAKYNIAVVMPEVGRSWYTDTAYGENYLTYVTEELPALCRSYFKGMSDRREDNYVAGLSMGGYGAIKAALTHPETYCGCGCLSASLDITRKNRPLDMNEWRAIFGFDLKRADDLAGTDHDIFALVDKNHAAGIPFPKLFLWCGTEDPLIECNRRLRDHLTALGIDHSYSESPGTHSWEYWDAQIQNVLKYLFE